MRWLLIALLCLLNAAALAGGRGGHNTKWDRNLFNGDWSCFGPQVAGCARGFDAICAGGSTNDQTAIANFQTYASAQGTALVNVYIAPMAGRVCEFAGDSLTFGIKNVNVWAYGVSIRNIFTLSGFAYFDADAACATTCALVQTVIAGSCTLTLASAGDSSKFAPGDWIQVGNIAMAVFGNPMTVYTSEAQLITAINTPTITIAPCLRNSYKSTYPRPGGTADRFQGGPGTIWKLQPSWNANTRWYGVTILDGQTVISGRDITLTDVVFNYPPNTANTPAPSSPGNMRMFYGFAPAMEPDKQIGFFGAYRIGARRIHSQSAGGTMRFESSSIDSFVGTTTNMTFVNTRVGSIMLGPDNGPGGPLVIDHSIFGSVSCANTNVDTSLLSYSAGTFTITNAVAVNANVHATFVPGLTYYFGETDGTNDSVPHTTFQVTDLRQDATNTYIDTGNWKENSVGIATPATLPSPTCNAHACFRYIAYQVSSLVSRFYTGPSLAVCVAP